jgi:hypothetical protein
VFNGQARLTFKPITSNNIGEVEMPNAQVTVRVTAGATFTYPDGDQNITVTGPTDINFVLTNSNDYSWSTPGATIDPSTGGFTVNAPNGATLKVTDTDTDGTVTGVSHEYTLHATAKASGDTFDSDPSILNKR